MKLKLCFFVSILTILSTVSEANDQCQVETLGRFFADLDSAADWIGDIEFVIIVTLNSYNTVINEATSELFQSLFKQYVQ